MPIKKTKSKNEEKQETPTFEHVKQALLATNEYITDMTLTVLLGYKEETNQIIATKIRLSFDGFVPNERKVAILECIHNITPILQIFLKKPLGYPIPVKIDEKALEMFKFECPECGKCKKCKKCKKNENHGSD